MLSSVHLPLLHGILLLRASGGLKKLAGMVDSVTVDVE
jgi:hypothetical protein